MTTFFASLYNLFYYKDRWISREFLYQPQTLSFSLVLLFLKVVAEYSTIILIFNLHHYLSTLFIILIGMMYFIYQLGWVLIKSGVLLLFGKGLSERILRTHHIFIIYCVSYYPFLLLPAFTIFILGFLYWFESSTAGLLWEFAQNKSIFLGLAIMLCWLWSAVTRLNIFRQLEKQFQSDSLILLVVPKLIELFMVLVLAILIVLGFSITITMVYEYLIQLLPQGLEGLLY